MYIYFNKKQKKRVKLMYWLKKCVTLKLGII